MQAAYSAGDLAKMRGLVTPEMLGYFTEELSGNASRGVENKVDAVKLEQGDLSEAWSEGSTCDYATVAMRFSMIDVTRNIADGTHRRRQRAGPHRGDGSLDLPARPRRQLDSLGHPADLTYPALFQKIQIGRPHAGRFSLCGQVLAERVTSLVGGDSLRSGEGEETTMPVLIGA